MEVENQSQTAYDMAVSIFENYGWYILFGTICTVVLYKKSIKHYVDMYKAYKFDRDYAAKYHKNPDVFATHVTAQQLWAEKMQEKYKMETQKYQEKMKEKEEKRKQELREKFASDGYVLGDSSTNNSNANNLRPESYPLMGGGGGSNYRPSRRSACGGGGCGR